MLRAPFPSIQFVFTFRSTTCWCPELKRFACSKVFRPEVHEGSIFQCPHISFRRMRTSPRSPARTAPRGEEPRPARGSGLFQRACLQRGYALILPQCRDDDAKPAFASCGHAAALALGSTKGDIRSGNNDASQWDVFGYARAMCTTSWPSGGSSDQQSRVSHSPAYHPSR
jgi:hypothetical protein